MSESAFGFARPLNVAVLLGGPSAERVVSLESGREVANALEARGHQVGRIDPGPGPFDADAFSSLADWRCFDVAFLALHGGVGEDGTVQRLLDGIGLPYTGSGADASATAFSKSTAKRKFALHGVATPRHVPIRSTDPRGRVAIQAATLGFPLAVKPDAQGSSLGVSIVREPHDLPDAIERCFALGPDGLLERYVAGEEWTVGLLGSEALPPMRVRTPREFLDFDAKYVAETTAVDFGDDAPPGLVAKVRSTALRACWALGVTSMSRVDLRVDGDGVPWVLEVNTLPGCTSHSAVPTAAARLGIAFGDLCERVIAMSLAERAERRAA